MEKVCTACPDVVFDFDVTESRRIGVGLQFISNGRYFILNNGPYFRNFDLGESLLPNENHNIFINPGPARTWFIRSVLDYDKRIPSNLFLANYQADDFENSQIINLASLVLGQNSVWGEILKISPEGVALFHDILEKYKQVRDDVMAASMIHFGKPGDNPEIYEKINQETGRGVVVIFANSKGNFSYITKNSVVSEFWNNKEVNVKIDSGHATIDATFNETSAAIIFFGVKQE
jgi:alpha-galactosidase